MMPASVVLAALSILAALSSIEADVVLQCQAKYGADFCTRLGAACSELTNTPIPQQVPGAIYTLPVPIANCMAAEMYVAMCYANFGNTQCITWIKSCKEKSSVIGISPYELNESEKECVTSLQIVERFRLRCLKSPSQLFCQNLHQMFGSANNGIHFGQRSGSDGGLLIVNQCRQKFGVDYCNNLVLSCYTITGLQVPASTSTLQLPAIVVDCFSSEMKTPSVMWQCAQKYGTHSCFQLLTTCSASTGITVSQQAPWLLPEAIVTCITSGMISIIVPGTNGGPMSQCINRYGMDLCNKMVSSCSAVTGVAFTPQGGTTALPAIISNCVSSEIKHPSAMWQCVQKYNVEFCLQMTATCSASTGSTFIHQVSWQFPQPINQCMLPKLVNPTVPSLDMTAQCLARYGADFCNSLIQYCSALTNSPFQLQSHSQLMPQAVSYCMSWELINPSTMWQCAQKYGLQFCRQLAAACSAQTGLPLLENVWQLPNPISSCMITKMSSQQGGSPGQSGQTALSQCLAKYDVEFCNKLGNYCAQMTGTSFFSGQQQLSQPLSQCISSESTNPSVMWQCTQKYGIDFCNQLAQGCSSDTGLPIPVPNRWQLPQPIAGCMQSKMSSGSPQSPSVMSQCITKYGKDFCDSLRQYCTAMTDPTAGTYSTQQQLSASTAYCMSSEMTNPSVMWKCVQKTGLEHCNALAASCSSETNTPLPAQNRWQLPQPITACILSKLSNPSQSTPGVLAQCVAKYGGEFCNQLAQYCAQMTGSLLFSPGVQQNLPPEQAYCISSEMTNPSVLWQCTQKFGFQHCNQLASTCSSETGVPLPQQHRWQLPKPVSACMSSKLANPGGPSAGVFAQCVAKFGPNYCNQLAQYCAEMTGSHFIASGIQQNLPPEQSYCMSSEMTNPSAMWQCVQKLGTPHCNQLASSCSSETGVLLPHQNRWQLPKPVAACVLSKMSTPTQPSASLMSQCIAKYGSDYCNQLAQYCAEMTGSPNVAPSVHQNLPPDQSYCMSSEMTKPSVMWQCTQKRGLPHCNQLASTCSSETGVPLPQKNRWQLPQPIEACMLSKMANNDQPSDSLMAQCIAKYGVQFCNKLGEYCAAMTGTQFGGRGTQKLPPAQSYCVSSEMTKPSVMWQCVQKYDLQHCNRLAATCSAETGTSLPQQNRWQLPQPIAACMLQKMNSPDTDTPSRPGSPGHDQGSPVPPAPPAAPDAWSLCVRRYGEQFCKGLATVCSIVTGGGSSAGGLSPAAKECMAAEMKRPSMLWQCIQQYGAEFCKKLMDACVAMTGSQPPRGSPWHLPQDVSNCISQELSNPSAMWLCIQKHDLQFCNRLAAACASITKVPLPPQTNKLPNEINHCITEENAEAVCLARRNSDSCGQLANICRDPNAPKGSALTIPEQECMKTQVAMATCKTNYGAFCDALQAECSFGTGGGKVSQGARGVYLMSTALRNCILNGGIMASCTLNQNRRQCSTWEHQCAKVLQTSPGRQVLPAYYQLSPQVALCTATQDIMSRCTLQLGAASCTSSLKNCKRRFNSPRSELPKPLFTLTPPLINCLARSVNKR